MIEDQSMRVLGRLLDVSYLRQQVHMGNLANQNTPGYRSKALRFEDAFAEALQRGGEVAAMQVTPEVYEPRNTGLDNDGNDVNTDREILEAAKNGQMYNAYVSLLRGKHSLYQQALNTGA